MDTILQNVSRPTFPNATWAFHQSLKCNFPQHSPLGQSKDVLWSLVSTSLASVSHSYQLIQALACQHWIFSPCPLDRVQGALRSQPARKEDHGLWHCLGNVTRYVLCPLEVWGQFSAANFKLQYSSSKLLCDSCLYFTKDLNQETVICKAFQTYFKFYENLMLMLKGIFKGNSMFLLFLENI